MLAADKAHSIPQGGGDGGVGMRQISLSRALLLLEMLRSFPVLFCTEQPASTEKAAVIVKEIVVVKEKPACSALQQ